MAEELVIKTEPEFITDDDVGRCEDIRSLRDPEGTVTNQCSVTKETIIEGHCRLNMEKQETVIKAEPQFITEDDPGNYEEFANVGNCGETETKQYTVKEEDMMIEEQSVEKVIGTSDSTLQYDYTSYTNWAEEGEVSIKDEPQPDFVTVSTIECLKPEHIKEEGITETGAGVQETRALRLESERDLINMEDKEPTGMVASTYLPNILSSQTEGFQSRSDTPNRICNETTNPHDVFNKSCATSMNLSIQREVSTTGIISNDLIRTNRISTVKKEVSIGSQESENRNACEKSGKYFNTPSSLKRFETNHTGVKPYQCEECGKSYTSKSSLKVHQHTHIGVKPYICEECGKSFTRNNDLTIHQRTHTGVKPYTCEECGKSFTRNNDLIIHHRRHTGVKPYTCTECGKSFTRSNDLTIHQRTHTGVKPYTCEECGKSFTTKRDLTVHQRTHTGVKPYTCEECGNSFTKKYDLTIHQRTHTGVKPYTCKDCGKSFTRNNDLTIHQRRHTGVKPYTCKECGKSFTRNNDLAIHQRTHTGVKQYVCAECFKSYTSLSSLKVHQHTHTGVKPYICHECGKRFRRKYGLTIHQRRHTRV